MIRRFCSRFCIAFSLLVFAALAVQAEHHLPSLDIRFQPNAQGTPETTEVPDFQKHISPLLGRLGCNGRACHGSFQGQGGFMLSLFGYDFDLDHEALMNKEHGRVDLKAPLESLILTKPVDADLHDGGKRFELNSWEYWVLRKWIEAGAPKVTPREAQDELKLVRLEVSPLEISFAKSGATQPLKAVAVWNDGQREEVTSLCRFTSNDTAIAQIDEHGMVTGGELGDTHVVVAYDNAVVPVTVLRPTAPAGRLARQIAAARTEIDRHVLAKLDKLGIQPSELASDAEFFRRLSLDVSGTLPTAEQVQQFLSDPSPDKRTRAIEEALQSPGYAAYWTTFFCDLTGNNDDQLRNFSPLQQSGSVHWYQWIYERVAKNVPYDQLVEGIVTAVSREPGETYRDYCEAMSEIGRDKSGKSFAQRSDMMYYWARTNQKTAEERAISFAYAFCGVRIQCAQCHKHPFDQWSKKDFDQFERLFDGIQANQNSMLPDAKKDYEKILAELGVSKSLKGNNLRRELQQFITGKGGEKTIPFPELVVRTVSKSPSKKESKKSISKAPTARLLGGDFVDLSEVGDTREPLMNWLRQPDNPYFSKALVNRVWAQYFGVGIVNPPDDLNLANAPSNGPLLDYLAQGFLQSGFDLQWLHREILMSDTYQRSWRTNTSNELDRRNFSHALLRRLPAETAYDALQIALSSDKQATALCNLESDRALTLGGASARTNAQNGEISGYALSVFGRSIRETNCDCDRSSDPSLLQTVFIRNDSDVLKAMTDPKRSWLSQVAGERGWTLPRDSQQETDKKTAQRKREQAELDDLDRKVRTYRAQLEKLKAKNASEKLIREAKSRLASSEKKLEAKEAEMAADSVPPESSTAREQAAAEDRESLATKDMENLIGEAYLRTLSRQPSQEERRTSLQAVVAADSPVQGLSDLMWALINSKEFILNH
jgi:hypothetical protein